MTIAMEFLGSQGKNNILEPNVWSRPKGGQGICDDSIRTYT